MGTLNKSGVSVATALGTVALVAVFLSHLAREILAAGQAERALGFGVVLRILLRPSFWVIGGLAFAGAFCIVFLVYRR